MNDAHDNAATDREMLERYAPGTWQNPKHPVPEEPPKPSPIHTDRTVQHIDVRLYFPNTTDRESILHELSHLLQLDLSANPAEFLQVWHSLISAYELKNTGFGNLLPADEPLA